MKASTATLGDVLDLLPLTLARRYDKGRFGAKAANEVLSEIEQQCDPDLFVGESGLILLEGVTDYRLPDSVRQIKGLYVVPAGDVVPDRDHPVAHQFLGNKLRLEEPWTLSDDADISGTVSASPPSDKTQVYHTSLFAALEEDALVSYLARVTHASGSVEYAILKGNSTTAALVNGELAAQAVAGDSFLITTNFLLIEHQRYLARFTPGDAALTTVLDLPQDFEYLFRCGLFLRYHSQSDSLSKETKFWAEEYATQLAKFSIDTSKPRGTSTRNSARSIPSLF